MNSMLLVLGILFSFSAQAEMFNGEILGDLNFMPRQAAPVSQWVIPNYSSAEETAILNKYNYLDSQHVVTTEALEKALLFFEANKVRIKNQKYLSIADYHQHSGARRLYIINLETGSVETLNVAHGSGSDPNDDGYADRFSNVNGSLATSLGFYLTAEQYIGHNGTSLRLDGVSVTNSNARDRLVVIHGAHYVDPSFPKMGMSSGCLAVAQNLAPRIVDVLKEGSLVYGYLP